MIPTGRTPFEDVPAVVAIPVKDEVERIAECLIALAAQHGGPPGVLLLVNNTTDRTMQAIADLAPTLACPILAIEHDFPPTLANAGQARRLAMAHADRLAPEATPLLTTDADGRAPRDWLQANLAHLRTGIDAVFGRAEIDPVEAASIPPALHQADARECAYAALLDHIETLLDPDPDDPWPRHAEHPGASIAVQRTAYRAAGGIPAVPIGEDRAFYKALRAIDARIRHAPEVRVAVSGRILGRAEGGMADTIRRRLASPDTMLDDALEPAEDRIRRARLRRAARQAFATARPGPALRLAAAAGLGAETGRHLLGAPSFGHAWSVLDDALPARRVLVATLEAQMARATAIRDALLETALIPA